MADAKSTGGGGSDWGMLEILLVVILLIGLMNRLSITTKTDSANTQKPVTTQATRAADTEKLINERNSCGLTLISPRSNEKVREFVTVIGTAGTCNWRMADDAALYAQVVDRKGVPISEYTKIAPTSVDEDTVSFAQSIPFIVTPATGTGYLILVPAQQLGDRTATVRIPLKL